MLLAIDTATRSISLALHTGQQLIAETTWQSADYHTVELAPQIALLLQRAGLAVAQLQGLAVASGPGSYTGLRIGVALAKGLALAHTLPLCGVSTFDILMRAQPPCPEPVYALLQAGRRRILAQTYHWHTTGWRAAGPTQIFDWPNFIAEIHTPAYLCGEIDAAGHAALRPLADRVRLAAPAQTLRRAGYLAEIGWERLRQHQWDDAAALAPLYVGLTPA